MSRPHRVGLLATLVKRAPHTCSTAPWLIHPRPAVTNSVCLPVIGLWAPEQSLLACSNQSHRSGSQRRQNRGTVWGLMICRSRLNNLPHLTKPFFPYKTLASSTPSTSIKEPLSIQVNNCDEDQTEPGKDAGKQAKFVCLQQSLKSRPAKPLFYPYLIQAVVAENIQRPGMLRRNNND